jgi:hypothetical protein
MSALSQNGDCQPFGEAWSRLESISGLVVAHEFEFQASQRLNPERLLVASVPSRRRSLRCVDHRCHTAVCILDKSARRFGIFTLQCTIEAVPRFVADHQDCAGKCFKRSRLAHTFAPVGRSRSDLSGEGRMQEPLDPAVMNVILPLDICPPML